MATAPIAVRVRELLAPFPRDRLEAIFRELDADGSGALSEDELTRGLAKLGVRITQSETEDLLDLFDVSDSGSLSLSSFLAFVSGSSSDASSVGQLVARVRGALLGAGQDALKSMFKDAAGRGVDSLTASQLKAKLTTLGVPGVTDDGIKLLLARMDGDEDGVVTFAELSKFLSQREFERVVRRLMENAADILRDSGRTLRAELLRAARRDAAAAAAAGRPHPVDEDSGEPEISYNTLKQVLVDDLGFPLSDEQLSAVLQCADIDGNGHCVVEEVLFLAGEDEEDGDDALPPADDKDDDDADEQEEEEEELSAASAMPIEDFVTILPIGEGRDDWWTPHAAPVAPAAAAADAFVMDDAFSAWAAAVTTVFNACAAADAFRLSTGPAPPTTPSPSGAPPPVTMDIRRMPQALNALGMSVSAAQTQALMAAAVAPGEQPGQAVVFARVIDAITDSRMRAGLHGMLPLTEGRIRRACSLVHGTPSIHGLTSTNEAFMMTRTALAAALVNVPGAALSIEDALALACACPGPLQALAARTMKRHAEAIAHGAGTGAPPTPSAAGLASVARRGSGVGFTVSRILTTAVASPDLTPTRPNRGVPESKADDEPSATAAATEEERELAQVSLAVAIARACPYADVDSELFLAWLRTLSRDAACRVRLMPPPAPLAVPAAAVAAGTGITDTPTTATSSGAAHVAPSIASSREWLALPPRAQLAMRKLLSPITNMPLPGRSIAVYTSTAAAAAGSSGSVSGTVVNSTFMSSLARLPMSFMPSISAAIFAVHPHTNVLRALLDGGDEADPAGGSSGAPASPSATADNAVRSLAGVGGDGFGLHLRHASILQGALDAPTSRAASPAAAISAAPVLRGIGAAATPADMTWASEGMLVRPQVQTAVVALQAASGVPIPADEAVRALIVARIARLYLLQLSPNSLDSQAPRMRILSNAIPCLASWAPTTEDVWTFNDVPATSMISRCVLRCDQPRDAALGGVQPGATYVCVELNAVLASPPAMAPPTDAAVRVAAIDDGMHMEEVTCAWGAIPLSQLCSPTVTSHKITLTGGALGAQADISSGDILQRRSNWRALTKAITGTKAAPEITLQTTLLSRLKVTERQELARLPLCIVIPHACVGIVAAWRRLYASLVLARTHSHLTAADDVHGPAHDVACLVQALSTSLEGLGGESSPLAGVSAMSSVTLLALARAMEEALTAAQKRRGGAPGAPVVLSELLARVWSTVAFAGNGLLAPPALVSDLLVSAAKGDATATLTSADMAYKPFTLAQGML